MTGAEVLAEIVSLAIKYGPDVIDGVAKIVAEIHTNHPELDAPPPADEEAAINAEMNGRLAADVATQAALDAAPDTHPSPAPVPEAPK